MSPPAFDPQWRALMQEALDRGERRADRTGVGTMALFGRTMEFDLRAGFPVPTTKRLACNQVWAELACFLRGLDSLEAFHRYGCNIWDGNGTSSYWRSNPLNRAPGDYLGRIYGVQWRDWRSATSDGSFVHLDQLATLRDGLRRDPHSRRHVVTAWNPGESAEMCLPPCHLLFQAFAGEDEDGAAALDMSVYMRSVDLFLGLPFDVASYATLQHLLCEDTGARARRLVFFLGDAHVYLNHADAVAEVGARDPSPEPHLLLEQGTTVDNFEPWRASLVGYAAQPAVKAPLNV